MMSKAESVLQRSHAAYQSYRKCSGRTKASFLEAIAAGIETDAASILSLAMGETALPEPRLAGEVARTCNQLRQFSAMLEDGSWVEARIDTAQPERAPLPKPDIRKMNMPLGPVVVFGASNFPLAYSTAGVDTASALAAGCTVVLKAHPAHPKTSARVAAIIASAAAGSGLAEDVFIHVEESGFEIGKQLVQHPLTKAVGFTGSFSGGKALYDYAQQRPDPIPVFSEMGSINPVFILPAAAAARSEQLATLYAASITLSVGQFCTNPGLLLGIKGPELDAFAQTLAEKIKAVAPGTMLHAGIADAYGKKRRDALRQKGVTMLGESAAVPAEGQAVATLAKVSGADFLANPGLGEEVFGPYSLLVEAEDFAELETIARTLPGQLTGTLLADEGDAARVASLADILADRVGRLIMNGVPTGVEVCPSMHHGGPFPATTDSRFSSVGTDAVRRFVRPVSFQNMPESMLPPELHLDNPLGIWRLVNNEWKR